MNGPLGIIVVDHGSRRAESNASLREIVRWCCEQSPDSIIEPAHMELTEPTISQAFDRCVARGARTVVVHPYVLAPGRHGHEDIPRLAADAAAQHPEVAYRVTEPLGPHPLLAAIICERVRESLEI